MAKKITLWTVTMRQDGRNDQNLHIASESVFSAITMAEQALPTYSIYSTQLMGDVLIYEGTPLTRTEQKAV